MSEHDQHLQDRLVAVLGRQPTADEKAAAYVGKKHGATHGEVGLWVPRVKVIKYSPRQVELLTQRLGYEPEGHHYRAMEAAGQIEPDEVHEEVGNLLVTTGVTRIMNLLTAGGGVAATNAQTFAGVGDSSTTAAVGQTTLQAVTNKWYQQADSTYPSVSAGVLSLNCTLTASNGNFAWNEWVIGLATGTLTAGSSIPGTSPNLLNRAVPASSMGTKASGAAWTLQSTITIA